MVPALIEGLLPSVENGEVEFHACSEVEPKEVEEEHERTVDYSCADVLGEPGLF